MARLYLDEDLAGFAKELQEAGHDVLSVGSDTRRRGQSDAWHFREALTSRRILLTWNRHDFEYLHRLWTTLHIMKIVPAAHAGILTAAPTKGFRPMDWLPSVRGKLTSSEPMDGRLLRWVERDREWREAEPRPEREE